MTNMIKVPNSSYYMVVTNGATVQWFALGRREDIETTVEQLMAQYDVPYVAEPRSYGYLLQPLWKAHKDDPQIQVTILTTVR